MQQAIRRFHQQREEHRREALRAGQVVGGHMESLNFAHVEHIVVCWHRLVRALLHLSSKQDLSRSFSKRLNRIAGLEIRPRSQASKFPPLHGQGRVIPGAEEIGYQYVAHCPAAGRATSALYSAESR